MKFKALENLLNHIQGSQTLVPIQSLCVKGNTFTLGWGTDWEDLSRKWQSEEKLIIITITTRKD